jgi:hypothetical protein
MTGLHQLSMPFLLFVFGLNASTGSHCRQEQHHFPLLALKLLRPQFFASVYLADC